MTTSEQLQLRSGTQSQMAAFTGAQAEVAIDTTNNRVVVQDGTTAGGWPVARLSDIGGGFLNRFRNGTMDVWQRGTSPSLAAGTSGSQYTTDGWIVSWTASAAAVPGISQAGGRLLTKNSLAVTGAADITDLQIRQRIESLMAAALCSQTVTVQAQVYNNTGAALTPKLTVNRATSQDNFASVTTDVSAVSLQSCANGVWTLLAYTFAANGNAYNGLEVIFDFGNTFGSTANAIQIAECDIRVTNGVPTGLNAAPPPPELRPVGVECLLCRRYFQTTYDNGTAPGTSTHNGMRQLVATTTAGIGQSLLFDPPLRADNAAMNYYDGAGNANKTSYYLSGFNDNSATVTAVQASMMGAFISTGTMTNPNFLHFSASVEL